MATFHGRDGTIKLDNEAELNVRSITIHEEAAAISGGHSDCTSYWRDTVAGRRSWGGSFEFYQDDTTPQPEKASSALVSVGDSVTIEVTDGHSTYGSHSSSITAVITNITYSTDVEGAGLVVGTATFVGDGQLLINGS